MAFQNERRKYPRVKVNQAIEINLKIPQNTPISSDNPGLLPLALMDLSAGGLRFISNLDLLTDEKKVYNVNLNVLDEEFHLVGHLIRKVDLGNGVYEYGYEFTHRDESQLNDLKKFAEEFRMYLDFNPNYQDYSSEQVRILWEHRLPPEASKS